MLTKKEKKDIYSFIELENITKIITKITNKKKFKPNHNLKYKK